MAKPLEKPWATSWHPEGWEGVECFRMNGMNHQFSRHSHEGYSVGVIEAGVGGFDCRGAANRFPASGIVAMNPDEVHTGYSAGEQPLSYRMFYIEASTFAQFLPESVSIPHFSDLSICDPQLAQAIRHVHVLLEKGTITLEKQNLMMEALSGLARNHGRSLFSEQADREPYAIRLVKEYLHAHFQDDVSIEDLAQMTQLNRAYLMRSFKKMVGIPPYSYLLQIRVEQAKKLLLQGNSIADVALAVGFGDQSHLTRRFKNITGITPKQYALGHYCPRNPSPF